MLHNHLRSSSVRSRSAHCRPKLEQLETRLAPAVTAGFRGGVLTLRGDDLDSAITVTELQTVGSYRVEGPDLAGGTPQTFAAVTSIDVRTGAGADAVTVNGDVENRRGLYNALNVAGTGSLTVTINGHVDLSASTAVRHEGPGPLTVKATGPGLFMRDLVVHDGDGDSLIEVGSGVHVFGYASFNLGGGANNVTMRDVLVSSFLSFVGGAGDDQLLVVKTTIHGNVAGAAGGGTNRLSLEGSTVLGAVRAITSGSDDTLTLAGGTSVVGEVVVDGRSSTGAFRAHVNSGASLAGNLRVDGGSGDETLEAANAFFGGDVRLGLGAGTGFVRLVGSVVKANVVHSGAGDFNFILERASRVDGYVSANATGSAATTVALWENTQVGRFISAVSGSGNNTLGLHTAVVGGPVVLKGAVGSWANVIAEDSTVAGSIRIDSGSDVYARLRESRVTGSLLLNPDRTARQAILVMEFSSVGQAVQVVGGLPDEHLTLSYSTVGGDFIAELGAGSNSLSTYAVTVGGDLVLSGSFPYAAETRNVTLGAATRVGGDLILRAGQSTVQGIAAPTKLDLGGGLSVGGSVELEVSSGPLRLTEATIGGDLTVRARNAGTNLKLLNTSVRNFVHHSARGYESIELLNARVSGHVSINSRLTDQLTFNVVDSSVAGFVSMVGGTQDGFNISNSAVNGPVVADLAGGPNSLNVTSSRLASSLTLRTAGTVTGVGFRSSSVQGAVTIDTTAATGQLRLAVEDYTVLESLVVRAGAAPDYLTFNAAVMNGPVMLHTGDGPDTWITDHVDFHGPVFVEAGAGADTVSLEAGTANSNGRTTNFYSTFRFAGGDGDDVLRLGLDDDDLVRIYGSFDFDGGAGHDTLDLTYLRSFSSTNRLVNFP